jgi:peptide/nickel transport system permease protein
LGHAGKSRFGPKGRVFGSILTFAAALSVLVCLSYVLPRLMPGDFVTAMFASSHVTLSAKQESEARAYFQREEGFGAYLLRLVRLDWGESYAFFQPVSSLILQALPWTLILAGGAHLLASVCGFLLGVEAAWRRGTRLEKGLVGLMTMMEGVPEMAVGALLLAIFALHLYWLPTAGAQTPYVELSLWERLADTARHLALPMATLVISYLPGNFLLARNSMVMVLGEEFILTARAKGLPDRRVRYAHAARNALLTVVTRFGLRLAFMVTGVVVVETIFSYPGIGTLLFNAIRSRDLPLIQGVVLFSSGAVLTVNLALEFLYARIDPRTRHAP